MRYALSVSTPSETDLPQAVTWARGVVRSNLGKEVVIEHAEAIKGSVMVVVQSEDEVSIRAWQRDSEKTRGRFGRLLWFGTVRRALQEVMGL